MDCAIFYSTTVLPKSPSDADTLQCADATKFLSNKGHTFRKWCQQKSVGAHVMRRRCRSSLGNASVIRIASTVEEKRSKKKLNCVRGNLKWSQQQQGIPPEKIGILSQKRVVSSTPAFRISQGILTIWLALVTCKLSDIPSSLLFFRVALLHTVKGR